MLLNEYIESFLVAEYPFFTDDAEVATVIASMREQSLECVPVVHEGKFMAMLTLLDLLPVLLSRKKVTSLLRDIKLEHSATIGCNEHLFDVVSKIGSFRGTLIPVSDEEGFYLGVMKKETVLEKIATVFHLGDAGMTLELDIPSFELKLSEVIATLEKNDATVLSFGLYRANAEGDGMVLSFRVQTHDLFRLVKNLEKYGYSIRYTSAFFTERDDELREKALEFIHFMDM